MCRLVLGVFHMLTRDDVYECYYFRAGTVFAWHGWQIALDPGEYPYPLQFWPERLARFKD
jgi:cytochrome P450